MLRGLVMDGHASLTLTFLLLFYRYVNVESIFTAEQILSCMVTPSHALS
jgi:hypothetical protein